MLFGVGERVARMPEQAESDAHTGGRGIRAVIAALLANLGIAVAKVVGFLLTGASSMLAEAFHSVADSGNQAMLLIGGRGRARDRDVQPARGGGGLTRGAGGDPPDARVHPGDRPRAPAADDAPSLNADNLG